MNEKTKFNQNDLFEFTSDINCVKIYNKDSNNMIIISYPEAALWDMIQQSYSYGKMVNMMAAILKKDKSETAIWVSMIIDNWINNRLLKK
jgi:hypothetical protein